MSFDYGTLITDRKQSDVDRVKTLAGKGWGTMTAAERAEWVQPLKGAYNASDLNRVGFAMLDLQTRLSGYGYAVDISPRVNWLESDQPTASELETYRANVAALRSALDLLAETPEVPETMRNLTYGSMNDIERILEDVDTVIEQVVRSFLRSNAFTAWSGSPHLSSADANNGRTWAELDEMDTEWVNWQVADWFLLLYGNLEAEGAVE